MCYVCVSNCVCLIRVSIINVYSQRVTFLEPDEDVFQNYLDEDDATDERDDVEVAIDNVMRRHRKQQRAVQRVVQYGGSFHEDEPDEEEHCDSVDPTDEQEVNDFSPEKPMTSRRQEDITNAYSTISQHQYSNSYQLQSNKAPTPSKGYLNYHDIQRYDSGLDMEPMEPMHSSRSQKGSRQAKLRNVYGSPEPKKLVRSNSFQSEQKRRSNGGVGNRSQIRSQSRSQSATRRQRTSNERRGGGGGDEVSTGHFDGGVPSWISRT